MAVGTGADGPYVEFDHTAESEVEWKWMRGVNDAAGVSMKVAADGRLKGVESPTSMSSPSIGHRKATEDSQYLWRERIFVGAFLISIFITLAHFVHSDYSPGDAFAPVATRTLVYYLFKPEPAPFHAPETYRVAIPALGRFLVRITHTHHPSVIAAVLDFVFGTLASYLLYQVVVAGFPLAGARLRQRTAAVALFLAFLQFAIPWVVPWQRPETLPTALYVALALYCLTRSDRGIAWSAMLLAATAVQGFVRADVPFALGIALALASLRGDALREFGTRRANLAKGIAVAAIAAGVQGYLQLVRFPHLSYWPGVSVVQFRNNLGLHNFSNLLLALFPYLVVGGALLMKRVRLDAVDALILVVSVIYLAIWFTVGLVDEVRLYVPFMMPLSVVAAKFAATYILSSEPEQAR